MKSNYQSYSQHSSYNPYKTLIKASHHNDLLSKIQNNINVNHKNMYSTIYRKKAHSHYAAKINKPFKLKDQPQYYDQLHFQQHFKAFVDSIDHFNQIQQNQPQYITQNIKNKNVQKLLNMETKVIKQTKQFTPILTIDPVNQFQRQKFLKQKNYKTFTNLKQRAPSFLVSEKQTNKNNRVSIFPTHKTIQLYKFNKNEQNNLRNNKKNISVSIPKQLNLKNKFNNIYSIDNSQSNSPSHNKTPHYNYSPTKSQSKNSIASPSGKNGKKFDSLRKNSTVSSKEPFTALRRNNSKNFDNFNNNDDEQQNIILNRLNQLNDTKSKKNIFRIQKSKIHDLLKNRYGNQIFTTFFSMASIENYDGMIHIFGEFLKLQLRNAHLFCFLTFDVNQDGLICQEDLYKISKILQINSIVHQDINKIVQWVFKTKTGRSTSDLPNEFINCPTLRQLKKLKDEVKGLKKFSQNVISNRPPIKSTGKGRSYVDNFYSTNYMQYEKDGEMQGGKAKLAHLMKKQKKRGNKKFSINFEMFRQIFKGSEPNLVSDLIYYLFRIKRSNKINENQMQFVKRKQSQDETKFDYKKQINQKDMRIYDDQKKDKVNVWLKNLIEFKKTFSTIKYK